MKRKSFVPWLLLMMFAFAVMSGGCGGSSSSSGGGGGDPGDGTEYYFLDLEGTWDLVPGSGTGTARGNYSGYAFTGSARAVSGTAVIWDIEDFGDGTANGEFRVESEWDVTVNVPGYGSQTERVPVNFESVGEFDPSSPERLKKTGRNVFQIQATSSGSGFTESGTMTITMLTATRANVTIKGNIREQYYGNVDYDVNFSVTKR